MRPCGRTLPASRPVGGIVPTASHATVPAIRAVSEVETTAQRPSGEATASDKPPKGPRFENDDNGLNCLRRLTSAPAFQAWTDVPPTQPRVVRRERASQPSSQERVNCVNPLSLINDTQNHA